MSDLDVILAASQSDFVLFTTNVCPYCVRAKNMLDAKGLSYEEHSVSSTPDLQRQVVERTGHRTVPAIWDLREEIPEFVGGSDDLSIWL